MERTRYRRDTLEPIRLPGSSPCYTDPDAEVRGALSAWGIIPRKQRAQTPNRQDNQPKKTHEGPESEQVDPKVFPDGKRLLGIDLGAKGVLRFHGPGRTSWGKITSRATMKR